MTHLRSPKNDPGEERDLAQGKNKIKHHPRRRRAGWLRFILQERGKLFVCTKSPAGEHVLAYFGARQIQRRRLSCNLGSTTLEQGNGSILASKPGSILASAEGNSERPLLHSISRLLKSSDSAALRALHTRESRGSGTRGQSKQHPDQSLGPHPSLASGFLQRNSATE